MLLHAPPCPLALRVFFSFYISKLPRICHVVNGSQTMCPHACVKSSRVAMDLRHSAYPLQSLPSFSPQAGYRVFAPPGISTRVSQTLPPKPAPVAAPPPIWFAAWNIPATRVGVCFQFSDPFCAMKICGDVHRSYERFLIVQVIVCL